MSAPVHHYNEQQAHDAYLVHIALLMAEYMDPMLKHNPVWTIHRQDAYERFAVAFEKAD